MSTTEPAPLPSQKDPTILIDPDSQWFVQSNKEYKPNSWYSSPDGSYEKILSKESILDKFSGINYKKLPVQPGQYYSTTNVPNVKYEWDEEEYWKSAPLLKTKEQLDEELKRPVKALENRLKEFEKHNLPVANTLAIHQMTSSSLIARKIEFEPSPWFQLNQNGYRKNWANICIAEYKPLQRLFNTNSYLFFTDYYFRFQWMRWLLTGRFRLKYYKIVIFWTSAGLIVDHMYMRKYRQKFKFH